MRTIVTTLLLLIIPLLCIANYTKHDNSSLADSTERHIADYIDRNVEEFLDDNFGITDIPRMIYHSLIKDNDSRRQWWEAKLQEKLTSADIVLILERDLQPIKNSPYYIHLIDKCKKNPPNLLSDELLAHIYARESLEWKEYVYSLVIWLAVLIVVMIVFTVGYVALFGEEPSDVPEGWWILNTILTTAITFFISYKYIIIEAINEEYEISRILTNNMFVYISSLNIFENLLY